MEPIVAALGSKNIETLKTSLAPIQSAKDMLSPEQQKSLQELLTLIHQWEHAPVVLPGAVTTTPVA